MNDQTLSARRDSGMTDISPGGQWAPVPTPTDAGQSCLRIAAEYRSVAESLKGCPDFRSFCLYRAAQNEAWAAEEAMKATT